MPIWLTAVPTAAAKRLAAAGTQQIVFRCVQAFPSLQVVPFALGKQVPTLPARLHAEHWSVQALLQQTPFTQNPEAH